MSPSEELEHLCDALTQRAAKLKATVERLSKKMVMVNG